jgi:hypothetical protein
MNNGISIARRPYTVRGEVREWRNRYPGQRFYVVEAAS